MRENTGRSSTFPRKILKSALACVRCLAPANFVLANANKPKSANKRCKTKSFSTKVSRHSPPFSPNSETSNKYSNKIYFHSFIYNDKISTQKQSSPFRSLFHSPRTLRSIKQPKTKSTNIFNKLFKTTQQINLMKI
jgi:hypothetical protein